MPSSAVLFLSVVFIAVAYYVHSKSGELPHVEDVDDEKLVDSRGGKVGLGVTGDTKYLLHSLKKWEHTSFQECVDQCDKSLECRLVTLHADTHKCDFFSDSRVVPAKNGMKAKSWSKKLADEL